MITVEDSAAFMDITDLIDISTANERSTMDRRTRQITSTAEVRIVNTSDQTLGVPVNAVVILNNSQVDMPTATGINEDGYFYFDLTNEITAATLAPGDSITFVIQFTYTLGVRFTYEIKMFGMMQSN